ncbi:helix-turn-helix domain-containing protein [Plesiomonas shigelloides subsp. oncorhynchi]|nr:helix-turn-helix domain-containing protein [Plesiomonas shigelloides]
MAGNDKLIFILLANYADDKNICWPSQATLAKESGLSDRSVRNITIRMEKLGYLRVLRRGSGVTPSKYQLVFNPANTNESESISKVSPEKFPPQNGDESGKFFRCRAENFSGKGGKYFRRSYQ